MRFILLQLTCLTLAISQAGCMVTAGPFDERRHATQELLPSQGLLPEQMIIYRGDI